MTSLQGLLDDSIEDGRVTGASFAYWSGEETYLAAAGVLSTETGFPVSTDSMFQIGSIAKTVTAVTILQLIEEGTAKLDSAITDYVPEFTAADPQAAQSITLRQLLNHSSGLYGDFFTDTGWGDDCLARLIDRCALLPFVHRPGEQFSYCNIGYNILGRIIELLTRQSYDDAIRTRVFDPLGLRQTETLAHRLLGRPAAIGHVLKDGHSIPADPAYFGRCTGPAGSTLTMSARDLLVFLRALANGGLAPNGNRILSDNSVMAMLNLERRVPGFVHPIHADLPTSELFGWGLGVTHFQWTDGILFGHDGVTLGQTAFARFDPSSGACAVLLCNQTKSPEVMKLARTLLDASIGQTVGAHMPPPPPINDVAVEEADRYVGDFGTMEGTYRFHVEGGRLMLTYMTPDGSIASSQKLSQIGNDAFALCNEASDILGTVLFQFEGNRRPAVSLFTGARRVPRRSSGPLDSR